MKPMKTGSRRILTWAGWHKQKGRPRVIGVSGLYKQIKTYLVMNQKTDVRLRLQAARTSDN